MLEEIKFIGQVIGVVLTWGIIIYFGIKFVNWIVKKLEGQNGNQNGNSKSRK